MLPLGFGRGFAVDQAVALDDMQRLAVGGAEASTVENGATLMPTVSITSVSPSYQPTEWPCQLGVGFSGCGTFRRTWRTVL